MRKYLVKVSGSSVICTDEKGVAVEPSVVVEAIQAATQRDHDPVGDVSENENVDSESMEKVRDQIQESK